MDIDDLRKLGGIVSAEPVQKEIVWSHADGEGGEITDTFTVFIRRKSFGMVQKTFADSGDRERSAAYISESVLLGEKGDQVLTYQDAYNLNPDLAYALVIAIRDVNMIGHAPPKN